LVNENTNRRKVLRDTKTLKIDNKKILDFMAKQARISYDILGSEEDRIKAVMRVSKQFKTLRKEIAKYDKFFVHFTKFDRIFQKNSDAYAKTAQLIQKMRGGQGIWGDAASTPDVKRMANEFKKRVKSGVNTYENIEKAIPKVANTIAKSLMDLRKVSEKTVKAVAKSYSTYHIAIGKASQDAILTLAKAGKAVTGPNLLKISGVGFAQRDKILSEYKAATKMNEMAAKTNRLMTSRRRPNRPSDKTVQTTFGLVKPKRGVPIPPLPPSGVKLSDLHGPRRMPPHERLPDMPKLETEYGMPTIGSYTRRKFAGIYQKKDHTKNDIEQIQDMFKLLRVGKLQGVGGSNTNVSNLSSPDYDSTKLKDILAQYRGKYAAEKPVSMQDELTAHIASLKSGGNFKLQKFKGGIDPLLSGTFRGNDSTAALTDTEELIRESYAERRRSGAGPDFQVGMGRSLSLGERFSPFSPRRIGAKRLLKRDKRRETYKNLARKGRPYVMKAKALRGAALGGNLLDPAIRGVYGRAIAKGKKKPGVGGRAAVAGMRAANVGISAFSNVNRAFLSPIRNLPFRAKAGYENYRESIREKINPSEIIDPEYKSFIRGKGGRMIANPERAKMVKNPNAGKLPTFKETAKQKAKDVGGKALKGMGKGIMGIFGKIAGVMSPLAIIIEPLSEVLGMFGEIIGTAFLPLLQQILGLLFSDDMMAALDVIVGALTQVVELIVDSGLFDIIADVLVFALEAIGKILSDPSFQNAIKIFIDAVVMIVQEVFKVLTPLMPILIPLLILFANLIAIFAKVFAKLIQILMPLVMAILMPIINIVIAIIRGIIWAVNLFIKDDDKKLPQVPWFTPSLDRQGIVERSGIAKVHKGEYVVKREILTDIVNETVVNNQFYGDYDGMARMDYEDSMRKVSSRRYR